MGGRGHPPDDQRWGRPAVGPGTSERTQGSPIHKPRGDLARGKRKRAPLGGGCQPPSPAVGFVLGQGQGGAAAAPPPGGWKTGRRSARLGCAQRIGPEEKCRAAAPKNSSGGARGGFALRKWGVGPRPESSHNRPNSAIPGRCQPPHFLRQIREKLTLMRSELDSEPFQPETSSGIPSSSPESTSEDPGFRAVGGLVNPAHDQRRGVW